MRDKEKLTAILVQILDFAGLEEQEQKNIYNTISSGLSKSASAASLELNEDMEAYLIQQIKQIVNDQVFDVIRN